VYPTTPANYFHVLRRQEIRAYRKPLIVFNSKSLLRHPQARSSLAEMAEGTHFCPIIPSSAKRPKKIDRIILCSGQVFYALEKVRELNDLDNITIIRIEQLSPVPYALLVEELDRFPADAEIVYCQEEPMNLGPYPYLEPRIEAALQAFSKKHAGKRATYAGRAPTAAVATGFKSLHHQEELEFLSMALTGKPNSKVEKMSGGYPIFSVTKKGNFK
jgi:2-oxoglutarate dehydrogenase E1 component